MPTRSSVEKTLSQAARAVKSGQLDHAHHLYSSVLVKFPGNKKARKALRSIGDKGRDEIVRKATKCQSVGHLTQAITYWQQAMALAPRKPDYGIALAECHLEAGNPTAALKTIEAVLDIQPDNPVALDARGRALRDLGRPDAAEASHRDALGHGMLDVAPLNHLGILAQARGDRAAAQHYYRAALDMAPDNADLHHNLSRVTDYTPESHHLLQMLETLSRCDPYDPATAPLHFALFTALDATDQHARAFDHLVAGNRLRKAATGFDIRREALRFASYKALFANPNVLTQTEPDPAFRPIFVVGLPRSGTTLIERILARIDGCQPCGELSVVSRAVATTLRAIENRDQKSITHRDLQSVRRDILDGFGPLNDGSCAMIDKMPLNFRWIGFICAALPEAKVVHIHRSPTDVAWSIYRHLFAYRGNGFAYDPADISTYMIIYRDIMQFWKTRFPDRIFDVKYEDLVTQTRPTTQALAQACNLPWSEKCLTPERSAGVVLTASSAQVRQPIYSNSEGQWRRYEAQLAPLQSALKIAGIT